MRLSFLGAAGTVTGSRHFLVAGGKRILVDCGLFQGLKVLRLRNREALTFDSSTLDAVVLTHAHLDHSGFLPVLVKAGFSGPIYCTGPTADLVPILLRDSGRIQEEDARYANRKGFSRHDPALPLYTEADARAVTPLLRVVPVGEPVELDGFRLTFRVAGHILGAASALLETEDGSVLFSGDLGRPDDLLIPPPDPPPAADTVVMESTYGGRDHPVLYPAAALALVLRRTARRGGVLMIPSFAVGRAQLMLYALWKIFSEGRAPRVPVFLNSPMAIDVTDLYEKYAAFHRLSTEECRSAFSVAEYVESVEESRALNGRAGPMVIIAGAGMLTGGRILHHIRQFAPHPRNTLLLTGFQAEGTRGAALQRGEPTLRVHGRSVPIRAEVATMDGLSAHADQSELLDWLAALPAPPRNVFLVHGEPAQSEALRLAARERLGMDLRVAEHRQTVTLR